MAKTYTLKLTKDELNKVMEALNYYSVEYYHKKIDDAKEEGSEAEVKYWEGLWDDNLKIFCKCVELKEGE